MKINWTAIGVIFGILSWVVTIVMILWKNEKKGLQEFAKLENQVNLCLKMITEQNRTLKAYFKKLDIYVRQLDVLWAVFEERTGRMPIDREAIVKQELENGNE